MRAPCTCDRSGPGAPAAPNQLTPPRPGPCESVRQKTTRAGLVTPEPKKRPRSSYIRFEADQPNECWQSDFTHYRLANGTDTEILSWLDDHSRYALRITAHHRVTGPGKPEGEPAALSAGAAEHAEHAIADVVGGD